MVGGAVPVGVGWNTKVLVAFLIRMPNALNTVNPNCLIVWMLGVVEAA